MSVAPMKGRTLFFVGATLASPNVADTDAGLEAAATAAGLDYEVYDGKASPDRYVEGVERGVAQRAAAIVVYGISPQLIAGALDAAGAAGIPVITVQTGFPAGGPVAVSLNQDPATGALMADAVLAQSGCNLRGVYAYDSSFQLHEGFRKTANAEVARLCPACELGVQEFKLATIATALESDTASLLQRRPEVNAIVNAFDGAAFFQAKAVATAGRDVALASQGGVAANLDLVVRSAGQSADVSVVPFTYVGWLAVDAALRAVGGQQQPKDVRLPVQLFTTANLGGGTDVAALYPQFSGFEARFTGSWK